MTVRMEYDSAMTGAEQLCGDIQGQVYKNNIRVELQSNTTVGGK